MSRACLMTDTQTATTRCGQEESVCLKIAVAYSSLRTSYPSLPGRTTIGTFFGCSSPQSSRRIVVGAWTYYLAARGLDQLALGNECVRIVTCAV